MDPTPAQDAAERCRRMEERLRILSEATRAFAEATTDSQRLLDTVARQVAEVVKDYCVVLLLSEDGQTLVPAALFDPDPEALRQIKDALVEPFVLAAHPLTRAVLDSGQSFFAPRFDLEQMRPPRSTARYFDFARRVGIHSMLIVALRVHGRSIGQLTLSRFRPDSPAFDQHDLELAESLASHAALAISNARLLVEARRERVEGKRMADRLQILAEAAREFSVATYDQDRLLDAVARCLGDAIGDMCGIRPISDDGQWLEANGAVYHRDPELLAVTRDFLSSGRQRVGEGMSGRVAATRQPLLVPMIHTADFVASSDPRYGPLLERLGATSAITLPLLCQGHVVGVANLLRSSPDNPYTEDDLRFAQSVCDHAALALGNARSYAAERAAREVAEKATTALRQSEARFARLFESGIVGILIADLKSRVVEANDAILQMVGYTRDEILSGQVSWQGLTPPEWNDVDARAIGQLTSSGIGALREKEYLRKDGSRVPVLIGTAMLEGDAGLSISFVLDLTERKQTQEAIERLRQERAVDARFRGLLEAAPDAMVVVGEDGQIALINGQAEAMFGYSRAEMIGQPIELLVPERFRASHPGHRHAYFHDSSIRPMGTGLELYGRNRDGTEFPIEVTLSPLETDSGRLVSSAIRDITERQQAEQHRFRLAAIVDASHDAIVGKTLEGVVISWNQGAERLFGYSAAEMVGQSIWLLVPPGLEDEERLILEAIARGEVKHFETRRLRKDGRIIDVSVTTSPVRDAAGRVVGIAKVARDITARKRADEALARAKDTAEAATRELEAFSYSVAHDLRAPLRGMDGFAHALLDDYDDKLDAEGRDCLQEITSNARKMGDLIDALLSLSKVTRSDWRPERIDLSALFREIVARQAAAESQRSLSVIVEEDLFANVDPQLARILFENLVGNAWKFTAKVPVARIEFGTVDEQGIRRFFIGDNGAGFDMAHAGNLFAPFQRLHTVGEFPGTGIGLATVQRIVHRHGGRISAQGKVGNGAIFSFTLAGAAGTSP